MKEPTIKCSETYDFANVEQLHAFIDEMVTSKEKGESNLFAVKTDDGIIVLTGKPTDEVFQEDFDRFKAVLASYPIDTVKCDITTISRFSDEDDIQDESYEAAKQIAGEVIIASEEIPVSDTDARPDDDGIIRRNLIVRWFKP